MDFESVDPFVAPIDTILGAGNYVGKVTQAEDGESSGGFAQIELKLENSEGQSRDWLVISDAEFSRRKVAGLFRAAGVEIKNEWFDEAGHCRQEVLDKVLLGKTVGWIVRDEDDWKDATKTRPRVQGYRLPGEIANPGPLVRVPEASTSSFSDFGTDLPIDTADFDQSSFEGVGRANGPDIPF